MVLRLKSSHSPGLAPAGPGGFFFFVMFCDLAWSIIFNALVTAACSIVVFAGLQVSRIVLFDELQRELRFGSPCNMDAMFVARHSGWVTRASSLLAREGGNPFQEMSEVRSLAEQRPDLLLGLLFRAGLTGIVGAVMLFAILVVFSRRTRLIPFSLSIIERIRLATTTIRLVLPWTVLMSSICSAAVWYVGFDREGGSRSLIDGMAPTIFQGAIILATCCSAVAVAACALLGAGLVKSGIAVSEKELFCIGCRYSLTGLAGHICPECGFQSRDWNQEGPNRLRAVHRKIFWWTATIAIVVGVGWSTLLLTDGRARAWQLLEPENIDWSSLGSIDTDGVVLKAESLHGLVTFSIVESRDSADRSIHALPVRWTLSRSPASCDPGSEGTLLIPNEASRTGDFRATVQCLPFGPVRFWRLAGDKRLNLDAPVRTFR